MDVQLRVTYRAGDRRLPEGVEVEWKDIADPDKAGVMMLVESLLTLPGDLLTLPGAGEDRTVADPAPKGRWVSVYTAGQDIPPGMRVRVHGDRVMRAAEMDTAGAGFAGEALSIDDRVECQMTANPGAQVWTKAK